MPRPVHIDPEILGGIPVFAGTRVPFQTLMDYLKEEQALSAFLADFPTVTREQVVAAQLAEQRPLMLPRFRHRTAGRRAQATLGTTEHLTVRPLLELFETVPLPETGIEPDAMVTNPAFDLALGFRRPRRAQVDMEPRPLGESTTDSNRRRPLIPTEGDHPFQPEGDHPLGWEWIGGRDRPGGWSPSIGILSEDSVDDVRRLRTSGILVLDRRLGVRCRHGE